MFSSSPVRAAHARSVSRYGMRSTSRYSTLRVLIGGPPPARSRSARQDQAHVVGVGRVVAAQVDGVQPPAAGTTILANLQRRIQAQQRVDLVRRGYLAARVG